MSNDENHYNHFREEENSSSLSGLSSEHGSDSSSDSASQPKKKKVKVEEASPNYGSFTDMAGDPNMIALGSMGLRPPAYNQNFNLTFGTGLPMAGLVGQPIPMGMGFPGTSPDFHTMGQVNPLFGYAPSFPMTHHLTAANSSDTPDAQSNNEDGSDGNGGACGGQPKPISGMTPIVFAPTSMHANNQMMARNPGGMGRHDENYCPTMLQVVSADSQNENGGAPTAQMAMFPVGNVVALQKPKKWVRWSDHEDQILRRTVEQFGENNFRLISEQVFHGSRTEVQCKNRWKKALQPGLVKGRWSKEEDDIITGSVAAGNTKWSDVAKHLPGRIGEQIKERWVNVLNPNVKKGVWTEVEMKILRDSQKELGNKWSEIAKRIPQNAISYDSAAEQDGPMMHMSPHLEEQAPQPYEHDSEEYKTNQQLYEHESEEYKTDELNVFDGREDV